MDIPTAELSHSATLGESRGWYQRPLDSEVMQEHTQSLVALWGKRNHFDLHFKNPESQPWVIDSSDPENPSISTATQNPEALFVKIVDFYARKYPDKVLDDVSGVTEWISQNQKTVWESMTQTAEHFWGTISALEEVLGIEPENRSAGIMVNLLNQDINQTRRFIDPLEPATVPEESLRSPILLTSHRRNRLLSRPAFAVAGGASLLLASCLHTHGGQGGVEAGSRPAVVIDRLTSNSTIGNIKLDTTTISQSSTTLELTTTTEAITTTITPVTEAPLAPIETTTLSRPLDLMNCVDGEQLQRDVTVLELAGKCGLTLAELVDHSGIVVADDVITGTPIFYAGYSKNAERARQSRVQITAINQQVEATCTTAIVTVRRGQTANKITSQHNPKATIDQIKALQLPDILLAGQEFCVPNLP